MSEIMLIADVAAETTVDNVNNGDGSSVCNNKHIQDLCCYLLLREQKPSVICAGPHKVDRQGHIFD